MPLVTSLPWVQGAGDEASDWLRGAQTGAQIAGERARLQTEQARTTAESQARSDTLKQQHLVEQQRLAVQQARTTAEMGLQQQRLAQAAEVNAAKTKEAALKVADQQGFASDLAGGMTIEQALYRHPRITSPAAAIAAHKDTLDRAGERLDLSTKRLDLMKQSLEERQRQFDERQRAAGDKVTRVGETVKDIPEEQGGGKRTDYIFGKPGSSNVPQFSSGKLVTIKSPKGEIGTVPAENLDKFLKRGYTKLE